MSGVSQNPPFPAPEGKDQVSVGVVAVNFNHSSSESSGSVYPLAIGNCKENREELPKLIRRLNHEKNVIKESGISVDGECYKIEFVVTLDYKSLLLLIRKIVEEIGGDVRYEALGGRGFDVEGCVFCTALRACKDHLSGRFNEIRSYEVTKNYWSESGYGVALFHVGGNRTFTRAQKPAENTIQSARQYLIYN